MDALIGLGLALATALVVALVATARRRSRAQAVTPPAPAGPGVRGVATASPVLAEPAALPWPHFRPVPAHGLSPERQRQLLDAHAALPRPSRLLDQLLSPAFIHQASASQLADLVAGEPLLAARVLKAVNAPFYGLPQPVSSIAQAVTYLGLTTVRITCLRYLFIAAFNTRDTQRQQAIDRLWRASALASDLMQRAASDLGLPDAPRWSSAVLLSFLGRLAVLACAPLEHLPALCDASPVRRAEAEEQQRGLCAAELGRLLMTGWELPASVVRDAVDIEWLLFEAPPWPADGRDEALVLCGLCVRLSERVAASGARAGGPWLDLEADEAHEVACLRVRMGAAQRARVQAWLGTPGVLQLLGGHAGAGPERAP